MGLGASSTKWVNDDMTSQKGKLVVITGANAGLGFVMARELAAHGAHVIMACRSEERGKQAEQKIRQLLSEQGVPADELGSVEFMQLDVSKPASVREFSRVFHERFDHLDLLLNNAGVYGVPETTTELGVEVHFGTNYLGAFQLTMLLLDLLVKSKTQARVVNENSIVHDHSWLGMKLAPEMGKTAGATYLDYGIAKLALMHFTLELQRRLVAAGVKNVISVAAHPGCSRSNMWANHTRTITFVDKMLTLLMTICNAVMPLTPPEEGARPILYAATVESVKGGEYYGPDGWFRLGGYPSLQKSIPLAYSLEAATKTWELSEKLLSTKFDVEEICGKWRAHQVPPSA